MSQLGATRYFVQFQHHVGNFCLSAIRPQQYSSPNWRCQPKSGDLRSPVRILTFHLAERARPRAGTRPGSRKGEIQHMEQGFERSKPHTLNRGSVQVQDKLAKDMRFNLFYHVTPRNLVPATDNAAQSSNSVPNSSCCRTAWGLPYLRGDSLQLCGWAGSVISAEDGSLLCSSEVAHPVVGPGPPCSV